MFKIYESSIIKCDKMRLKCSGISGTYAAKSSQTWRQPEGFWGTISLNRNAGW